MEVIPIWVFSQIVFSQKAEFLSRRCLFSPVWGFHGTWTNLSRGFGSERLDRASQIEHRAVTAVLSFALERTRVAEGMKR